MGTGNGWAQSMLEMAEHKASLVIAKCQECTAEACSIGLRMVQQMASEAKASAEDNESAIFK